VSPTIDPGWSDLVFVGGGTLPPCSELSGVTVADFRIAKVPVTWDDWASVRIWAEARGYQIAPGKKLGPDHPVVDVSWHDAIRWCNAKSEREGCDPVYLTVRSGQVATGNEENHEPDFVVANSQANGFRLPSDSEWEWTARGGKLSAGHKYSGHEKPWIVGWYWNNSGGVVHPVGRKQPNELGVCDMSGNVWEWCWDDDGDKKRLRGGSSSNDASGCEIACRHCANPSFRYCRIGFRLARNA